MKEHQEWWRQWAKQLRGVHVRGNVESAVVVKRNEDKARDRHPFARHLDGYNPGRSFPSVHGRGGSEGRSID